MTIESLSFNPSTFRTNLKGIMYAPDDGKGESSSSVGSEVQTQTPDYSHAFDNFTFEQPKQEIAAPVKADTTPKQDDGKGDVKPPSQEPVNPDGEKYDNAKFDPEKNKAFKELRVKAETAEKRIADYDKKIAALFGDMGVKSLDDYLNAVEKEAYESAKEQLRDKGIEESAIDAVLQNNPTFKALLELKNQVETEKQEIEEQKKQDEQQKFNQEVRADFEKLTKEFPNVFKGKESITQPVQDLFDKGYSLYDAFYIANRTAIEQQLRDSSKQAAINQIGSKAHMKSETDSAGDAASDISIDPETMEMYKDNGMTEAQAREFHRKIYKR
jgi:hypothetical protein